MSTATDHVHARVGAVVVPESTAVEHCTVLSTRLVVVTVIRGEHHSVVVHKSASRISCVARVPGYLHPVVGDLVVYNERTVLGVVPAAVATFL